MQDAAAPLAHSRYMNIHELFPYLCVHDAAKAIAFYVDVFGAVEKFRLVEPSGKIGHCELDFGRVTVMLAEEYPELGFVRPTAGAVSSLIHLHVDNCDDVIARVVAAGGEVVRPATDEFYGERSGTVRDPFGHRWMIGHSIEDITPEEMQRRYTAAMTT